MPPAAPLPSAFGKMLTSGAAFSSFPACSCFQGNKIPQARAEVSHLNVTQANNQGCSALPVAQCSQPGRPRWCRGDVGAHAPCRDAPIMGTPVNHWEQRPIPRMLFGRWAALGSAPGRSIGVWGAGGRFWGSSNLPPSSNLAKLPCFWYQGLSGGSLAGGCCLAGTGCGFAMVTASSCPASLLLARWQRAGGGAVAEPRCCQWDRVCPQQIRGKKNLLGPPCPHCSIGRVWRQEAACGLQHLLGAVVLGRGCLGRAGPARCACTAGVMACQCLYPARSLLAHILTPKMGHRSLPSLSFTSAAWGWLLSAQAPSRMDLTGFLYLRFLHLSPPKKGSGWTLLQAVYLPTRCRLLCSLKAWEQPGTSPKSLAGVPGEQPAPRQGRGLGFLHPHVQPRLSSSILAGGNWTQVGAEGCVSKLGSGT